MNSTKLDSYVWAAQTACCDPAKSYKLSPTLSVNYMERYLLMTRPELKDLWNGFKKKLTRAYDALKDKDGKNCPTADFLELDARYCLYYFDEGGTERVKEYLLKVLRVFEYQRVEGRT